MELVEEVCRALVEAPEQLVRRPELLAVEKRGIVRIQRLHEDLALCAPRWVCRRK